MSSKGITLGKSGEDLAIRFLRKKGYTILQSNYRTRCGEIDIIARDKAILVFVEVKTRKGTSFGSPFSAVTTKKQRHISMVAQEYLSKNNFFDEEARFDVIAVLLKSQGLPQIDHIENAFELCYGN